MRFAALLALLALAVGLAQLWFAPFSPGLFFKVEITLGALCVVALVLWFVRREQHVFERTRNGRELD